jgi:hypothetical protein
MLDVRVRCLSGGQRGAQGDPLWRLPLHASYNKMLESKVADINSTGEPGSAGAITAALFLARFAQEAKAWVHIDTAGAAVLGASLWPRCSGTSCSGPVVRRCLCAARLLQVTYKLLSGCALCVVCTDCCAGWVAGGSAGPGRPEGGEALGLRALWRFLQDRYARPPSAQQQP